MSKTVFFLIIVSCFTFLSPFSELEASTYYLPYYTKGNGVSTGVGLTNLSATSNANVTVKIYDQSGVLVRSHPVQLPPNGQWSNVVGDSSAREGWIQVDSDQLLSGLCFVAKDDCMMDVPITEILSGILVVPHAAQDTIWDTVLYVANPNGQPASVTVRFRNKNGNVIATKSMNVPAMGSEQIPLSGVLGTTEAAGGSVLVESTRGIAGFALYNNRKTGQYWYAGINALAVDVSDFDGTWTGTARSIPAYDEEGGTCGAPTSVSFEVYRNMIEGSFTSPDQELIRLNGAITYEGKLYGFIFYQDEQVGVFSGDIFGNQFDGNWFDFAGCHGPVTMQKQ